MCDEKQPAEEATQPEIEPAEDGCQARVRDLEERVRQLEQQNQELTAALQEKEQRVQACEKDAREYLEGWQREKASFANYRKRVAREMDDAGVVARADLIAKILPAIDNLERALADTTGDAEVVRKGVRMTYEQLMSTLQQQGLKEVPTKGEPFDPNVHEAVDAVEGTGQEPNTVIEDVQKGYTFGERLVRPARVRVAR